MSHQLRKLEDALGYELFQKAGRGIVLTEAGKDFSRAVADGLQGIFNAANRLSEINRVGSRLNIVCPAIFASDWLTYNIADFIQEYPKIECYIRVADNDMISNLSDMDIAIIFGNGSWNDKWAIKLEQVRLSPLCSSAIFSKLGKNIIELADLRHVTLLHRDDGDQWCRWLKLAGETNFHPYQRNLYCNDPSVAFNMARAGMGVALAGDDLSLSNFACDGLVRPFKQVIDNLGSWYIVCDPARLQRPAAKQFLSWITSRFGIKNLDSVAPDLPDNDKIKA